MAVLGMVFPAPKPITLRRASLMTGFCAPCCPEKMKGCRAERITGTCRAERRHEVYLNRDVPRRAPARGLLKPGQNLAGLPGLSWRPARFLAGEFVL